MLFCKSHPMEKFKTNVTLTSLAGSQGAFAQQVMGLQTSLDLQLQIVRAEQAHNAGPFHLRGPTQNAQCWNACSICLSILTLVPFPCFYLNKKLWVLWWEGFVLFFIDGGCYSSLYPFSFMTSPKLKSNLYYFKEIEISFKVVLPIRNG